MSDRGAAKTQDQVKAERIAKVIARAGVCSRRAAEKLIGEGRVAVNGAVLASPAFTVTPADAVTIDGVALAARERTRLWLFNKPRGLVTSNRDPQGRATVFSALPADLPRVVSVGRLDINTEGLLLLTNDGGLARILELPSTGWLRRYRVRVHGRVKQADLDRLARGVTVEGMVYGPVEATLDREQGANSWLTMGLREGKNREIKKILDHLGLTVTRLIRISYGPFQLGDLATGAVQEVKSRVLRDQLGGRLSAAAGVDFDTPARQPAPAAPAVKRAAKGKSAKPAPGSKPTGKPGAKRGHARRRRPL
jgi:23S rRNA pseudouridine2605 synthase